LPPDLLEEVFELNMLLKNCEPRKRSAKTTPPALLERIGQGQTFAGKKYDALLMRRAEDQLGTRWTAVDGGKKTTDTTGGKSLTDGRILNRMKLYPEPVAGRVNEAMENRSEVKGIGRGETNLFFGSDSATLTLTCNSLHKVYY